MVSFPQRTSKGAQPAVVEAVLFDNKLLAPEDLNSSEHEDEDVVEFQSIAGNIMIKDITKKNKITPFRTCLRAMFTNGGTFRSGPTIEAIAGMIFEVFGDEWEHNVLLYTDEELQAIIIDE